METQIQVSLGQLLGVSGALLVLVGTGFCVASFWLKTRLTKSIEHEYASHLEKIKLENGKVAEIHKRALEEKLKAYSRLVNLARSLMRDPSFEGEENREKKIKDQAQFLEFYNGEILLSAPKSVIDSVQSFIDVVNRGHPEIKIVWPEPLPTNPFPAALSKVVKAMRADLNLPAEDIEEKQRIFSLGQNSVTNRPSKT